MSSNFRVGGEGGELGACKLCAFKFSIKLRWANGYGDMEMKLLICENGF